MHFFLSKKKFAFFFFNIDISESQQFILGWMKHSKLTQSGLYVCSVWFAEMFLFWTEFSPLPLILQFGHWTEKKHSSPNFIMILQMTS